MALDPSIFAQFGTRPKSAFEYLQEMAAMEDAGQRRESNRLALMTQRGQYEDQMAARDRGNRLREALQGLGAGATDDQRIGVLESHGEFGQADTLRKGVLERQKTKAQVAKDNAAAKTSELQNTAKQIDIVLQAVSSARDQPSYTRAVQFLQANGIDTSNVPPQFDPQAVAEFGRMALTAKERADLMLKENNELIGLDGKVNQALLGAKQQVAKAGASNISVSTEKGLLGEVATGLGKDIVATSQSARDAQGTLDSVRRIRAALDSGKVVTGTGANQRLLLGQIGYTLGLGDAGSEETLAQTRAAIQGLADLSLTGASAMRGQGQITENERKLLERARSGDITMTEPELRTLLGTFDKVAKHQVNRNTENVKTMKGNPNAASLVPFLESNGAANGAIDMRAAIEAEAERRRNAKAK